jgi:DNA-binding NtrC family response regulator
MKSGAVEFLTKPFRDQELLDAIHQALDRDQTSSTLTNSSAASPLRSAGESSTACAIRRIPIGCGRYENSHTKV